MKIRSIVCTTFAAGAMLLAAQAARADWNDDRAEYRGYEMRSLELERHLTADQRNRIRPILDSERWRIAAVRNDPTLTRQQKAARLRDIERSTRLQIDHVLATRQNYRSRDIREDRREQWRGRTADRRYYIEEQREHERRRHREHDRRSQSYHDRRW